jgi:hypothetical protein
MSDSKKGENNSFYGQGKKHTDETKAKLSQALGKTILYTAGPVQPVGSGPI